MVATPSDAVGTIIRVAGDFESYDIYLIYTQLTLVNKLLVSVLVVLFVLFALTVFKTAYRLIYNTIFKYLI